MFGFHRESNMFETSVVYKNRPIIEIPPELKAPEPPPQTRAEARDQNKRRYLPGERLQIKLNKQLKHDKAKTTNPQSVLKDLQEDDIDKISKSLGRVMSSLL